MSDELWGRIVLRAAGDHSLKGQELRVLISIASRCYRENPTQDDIANDCGMHSSKVCRSIKKLGAYIEKIRGNGGRRHVYRLIILPREAVPPEANGYCRGRQWKYCRGGQLIYRLL
jgi:hypothetical protein